MSFGASFGVKTIGFDASKATLDNPNSSNPKATPDQDTRYSVKVMNAFGCFDTASVNVTLKADFAIEPNNLITLKFLD
jgi:hypothetical protein